MRKIIAAFRKHYDTSFTYSKSEIIESHRLVELHPSSFPYCSLRHAYELLKYGTVDERDINMGGSYFTSVGTAVHLVMQEWLGKVHKKAPLPGKIIGNWYCKKCDKLHRLQAYTTCKKCGGDTSYEELTVSLGKHIRGQVDGVYKIGKDYYIIDYKTTSTFNIEEHKRKGKKFPYLSNKKQIESYCVLIEKEYGIQIKGWILVYAARDNPQYKYVTIGEELTRLKKTNIEKRLLKYDRHFGTVLNLKTIKDIRLLIKEKPCKQSRYYWQQMHNVYAPCPLAEDNKCWSHKLEHNMVKLLRKNV